MVAARELYRLLPAADEGSLTELRAAVVRGETLARIARHISLGAYLLLGQGEESSGGRERESNLAAALEALVGAVLLDRGVEEACDVALRLIRPEVERVVREGAARDPKSRLQEVTQGLGMGSPTYNTASQTGPEQDRIFRIEVMVAGRVMGSGSGRRKVDGERAAALEALALLAETGPAERVGRTGRDTTAGTSDLRSNEMLGQVHDHIVRELGESSRTDTIFVLTAIVFNLLVLAVSSGMAVAAVEERAGTYSEVNLAAQTYDILLAVFIGMTLLINAVAVAALAFGRRNRRTLLDGLVAMYRDNDVDRYYDPSLVSNYGVRYLLFGSVIVSLALTAIVVPIIIRLTG